jgi:ankyrin repeat protein
MVRLLLDHGADPNVRTKSGSTPLHWAAMCGMEEASSLLISAGAETAWKNGDRMTPLHCAVEGGAEAFVRVLGEVGVDGNEEMDTSEVTVTEEEYYRRRRVVRIVLDHTARLDAQEVNGETALHYAAREGRRKVVKWLLEKGADAYVKDRRRFTPLDVARAMGHTKVEELLEEHYRQNTEPLWRVFVNNVLDIINVGA